MDWIMSLQNSFVEALTLNVMAAGDGDLEDKQIQWDHEGECPYKRRGAKEHASSPPCENTVKASASQEESTYQKTES